MTEKIERIARTILWVVLAVSIVAVPLGVLNSKSEVEGVREEMKATLKIAEDTEKRKINLNLSVLRVSALKLFILIPIFLYHRSYHNWR